MNDERDRDVQQYKDNKPIIEFMIIFLPDHVSSAPAILLPVEELVTLCRERHVIIIVCGAHAPGHVSLNLSQLDADFYVGQYKMHLLSRWYYIHCAEGTTIIAY